MKIMMIDCSPKVSESNSSYFLDALSKFINEKDIIKYKLVKNQGYENIINNILNIDKLIIALPLYVDSIPSHLLRLLTFIEDEFKGILKNIKVYVMINCGFYEGIQNRIALQIMKCWCKRLDIEWGQGIGIGSGEMIGGLKNVPIDKGPNKSLGNALKTLANNINSNSSGDDIFTNPSGFPRFAFKISANIFWAREAKRNGLKKKELNRCVIKH